MFGLVGLARAATAQPYVYALAGQGFFHGVNFTSMAPRMITIDTATGEAVASLALTPCANTAISAIAARQDGTRVFVACGPFARPVSLGGRILIIDPVAKQIIGARDFDIAIAGLTITPGGDRLVALHFVNGIGIEILDSASLATLGTVQGEMGSGGDARGVAASDTTAYFGQNKDPSGGVV